MRKRRLRSGKKAAMPEARRPEYDLETSSFARYASTDITRRLSSGTLISATFFVLKLETESPFGDNVSESLRVLVVTAATGTGTAAGAAASSPHVGQWNFGSDEEAHGACVNSGSTDGGPQFLRRTEGVTVLLGDEILFIGFVKRKAYAGTAASAGGEIQTNGRFFLVGEEGVKFSAGAFGESKHLDAPLW